MQTSAKGRKFIHLHEGNPLTCYLDPVNVPTIGPGLTNRSPTVTRMLGRLVPGKTRITAEQGDRVFAEVLANEVDPIVTSGMPGAKQHEHDAGASGSYNLGATRFMSWQWAKLWRAGKKQAAAEYLAENYNTAGGKKLPGLVRRRKEEALLLAKGIYTGVNDNVAPEGVPREAVAKAPAQPDPVVREAQTILTEKGFNPGAVDGWMGEKTRAAILAYQQAHPHLVADGILGPATLSQLRRDAEAVRNVVTRTVTTALPSAGITGVAAFFSGLPWHIIGPAIFLIVVAVLIWRYRDLITRKLHTHAG